MAKTNGGLATADEPAPIVEAEPGDCARPRSPGTVFVITADPRTEPKALPGPAPAYTTELTYRRS
ncbi:hypothetical protein ACVWXO_000436 [Bradyrhizobium sp. LM2.7]